MDIPTIHWIVSPPTKWQNEEQGTLPKIVCALHDELEKELVTNFSLCETESGGASSRASSLESEMTLPSMPSITFNDYCEAETDQSDTLSDDFAKISLQTDSPNTISSDLNETSPVSGNFEGFYQSHRPSFRRSFSRQTITIKLAYFDNGCNCDKAPRTVIMKEIQHFQVLLGSVAESLSIGPESVSLWISVNSQETKLSPICSPRELGVSGELEIHVRIGNPKGSDSNGSDLCVGNRIPGTHWIRSFPTRVYKCGLPKSPSQSRTIIQVSPA